VEPIVAETPPYMRATTFASMDSPGPFEKSIEAYFYITLPDSAWSKEKQEQQLAFYSPPTTSDTSVHEVYPGHYVQFLVNRLNPDLWCIDHVFVIDHSAKGIGADRVRAARAGAESCGANSHNR
jgi:hypothetical protein